MIFIAQKGNIVAHPRIIDSPCKITLEHCTISCIVGGGYEILGTYSKDFAESVFDNIVEAYKCGDDYFEMPDYL